MSEFSGTEPSTELLPARTERRRRRKGRLLYPAVGFAAALAVTSVVADTVGRDGTSPSTSTATANSQPLRDQFGGRQLDNLRTDHMTLDRLGQMYNATVRLRATTKSANHKGGWTCTGTYVNDKVLTASHCLSPTLFSSVTHIDLYHGDPRKTDPVMKGRRWQYYRGNKPDVGAVKVQPLANNVPPLLIGNYVKGRPQAGEQFYMDALPGERTVPRTAHLTYVGHDSYSGFEVFQPNTPEDRKACAPGASGSLLSDGLHYAIHRGIVTPKQFTGEFTWSDEVNYFEHLAGADIDMHNSSVFCMGTLLTPQLVEKTITFRK